MPYAFRAMVTVEFPFTVSLNSHETTQHAFRAMVTLALCHCQFGCDPFLILLEALEIDNP